MEELGDLEVQVQGRGQVVGGAGDLGAQVHFVALIPGVRSHHVGDPVRQLAVGLEAVAPQFHGPAKYSQYRFVDEGSGIQHVAQRRTELPLFREHLGLPLVVLGDLVAGVVHADADHEITGALFLSAKRGSSGQEGEGKK